MLLLRVGVGEARKLQKGELGSFKKGSLEASEEKAWRSEFWPMEAPIPKGECWK